MKRLLLIFMSCSLQGMTPILVCNTTATITAQETTKMAFTAQDFSKAITALGVALQIKAFIQSPLDASVAYGIEKGVGYSYPKLKDWIGWQMAGDITKLSAKRKDLKDKISKSCLPMRLEHNELATIEHILKQKITAALSVIAHGNKEQALKALKSLQADHDAYLLQDMYLPGVIPPVKSIELLRAQQIYTERFSVDPQLDMVITTQDMVYATSREVFADLDISKFKSEDAFVNEVTSRIKHMKNMGVYDTKNGIDLYDQIVSQIKSTLKSLDNITRRFQQRMKISTVLKIMDGFIDALYPMIKGKSLKQNLHDAVYSKRPHLGQKFYIVYRDDIAAFADAVTDIMLMLKNEVTSKLKLGAAVIDLVGNLVDKLDTATETIYRERMNEKR